MKKLLTISFVTAAFLFITPTVAFASDKFHGENNHSKDAQITKSETKTWNQGKSKSDPDDNGKGPDRSNGGYDKPGYSGGINDDRDGNNGCGNDSDREDDNEGWCGTKPKTEKEDKKIDKCESKCDTDEDKDKDNENEHKDEDKDHGKEHEGNCNQGGSDNDNNDDNTSQDSKDENTDTNETVNTSGTVLAATTLPNTGISASGLFNQPVLLLIGLALIVSGIVLMGISVFYRKTFSRPA